VAAIFNLVVLLAAGAALAGFEKVTSEKFSRAARGLRNRNPGNVRPVPLPDKWRGQIGVDSDGFSIFDTIENGVRAMTVDIAGDIVTDGNDTLKGLIAEYAPSTDGNDESAYVNFLSTNLGIGKTEPIPRQKIEPLIFAIARFEGQPLYEHWPRTRVDFGIREGFRKVGLV